MVQRLFLDDSCNVVEDDITKLAKVVGKVEWTPHKVNCTAIYRVHCPITDTRFLSRAHISTGHIIGSYYYLWVDIGFVYDP